MKKDKQRIRLAMLNASEMIRQHVEIGLNPEDVNETTERGLNAYKKACHKVADILEKQADKL